MNLEWTEVGEGREEYVDVDDTCGGFRRPSLYGAVVDGEGLVIDSTGGWRGEGGKITAKGLGKQFVEQGNPT